MLHQSNTAKIIGTTAHRQQFPPKIRRLCRYGDKYNTMKLFPSLLKVISTVREESKIIENIINNQLAIVLIVTRHLPKHKKGQNRAFQYILTYNFHSFGNW